MSERVVFKNRQRIGDILAMTCAVRDFKKTFPNVEVGIATTCMHIWDNNPYVNLELGPDDGKLVEIGTGIGTNQSNRVDTHMANAYRLSIQDKMKIKFEQGPIRPDIWLTKEEFETEPLVDGPYWILCIGGEPGWPAKMYPRERWIEVVRQLPETKFVQIGASKDPYKPINEPNVVDYIGETEGRTDGIRKLFNLFLNAQGSVGLVSFHMHLSAAFNNPCVVVNGAREPEWFTHYFGHQYLSLNGTLKCSEEKACWACEFKKCKDAKNLVEESIPRCVDLISVEDIVRSIRRYYDGGRLEYGKKTKKRDFIRRMGNVVGLPQKVKGSEKQDKEDRKASVRILNSRSEDKIDLGSLKLGDVLPDGRVYAGWGMTFGGARITDRDWAFMEKVVREYEVLDVLEFGSGLSTLLMVNELNLEVESYEKDQKYIKNLTDNDLRVKLWDGVTANTEKHHYSMAFVDGPSGGESREYSTKIASEKSDVVIVHDAGRAPEKLWQEKYLAPGFKLASKGGHRCHLWVRQGVEKPAPPPDPSVRTTPPLHQVERDLEEFLQTQSQPRTSSNKNGLVRICFNGRGDGGAEHSVTWMANRLTELGKTVIYHSPSGQPCATFKRSGDRDIKVEDFQRVSDPCEVLFFYANDSIWGLDKPVYEEAFRQTLADRRVMGLNYKVGGIGKVGWTLEWDRYLFLSSLLEEAVLSRAPTCSTRVLPPPTDLADFYTIKPDYNTDLRLVRHSSQGNTKYAENFPEILDEVLKCRPDVSVRLMPPPDFLHESVQNTGRVFFHKRNTPPVPEFLSKGNCFWYTLPVGYTEGGPKVVMEAMAAGLPVIADNHSGMADRVERWETGWLCDDLWNQLHTIKRLDAGMLKKCGGAARERAREQFNPELWIDEILGR